MPVIFDPTATIGDNPAAGAPVTANQTIAQGGTTRFTTGPVASLSNDDTWTIKDAAGSILATLTVPGTNNGWRVAVVAPPLIINGTETVAISTPLTALIATNYTVTISSTLLNGGQYAPIVFDVIAADGFVTALSEAQGTRIKIGAAI